MTAAPSSLDRLKALSVRQPWAWAIIHAGKDVENRSAAAVRFIAPLPEQRIAIHAAKGMTRQEYAEAADFMAGIGVECPRPADLIRGAIIGSVTIDGIVSRDYSRWFFGPRALVITAPRPCEPIPAVGALGLFSWSPAGEIAPPAKWMLPKPGAAPAASRSTQGSLL